MNRKVLVVYSNPFYASDRQPFPPVGAVGETVSEMDGEGEYDVMFYDYPCKTVGDPTWVTHKSMIVFIDNPPIKKCSAVAETEKT